jgi:DNA-binding transcriptional LysR family regulator
MRGLNLDQLSTFIEVIERGSFSAAADHLDLTQPAVSLQIRQLEKRLGVRLIERVGRRAQPTPAGAELLVHARAIADAVTAAQESVAPYASGTLGRVRIGTGATACIHFLPPVLRDLRKRFPKLEIIISTGRATDVLRQLEDNALDLGLVTLPAPGRMFDVTPLLEDEFVVLSSPAGPALPRAVTADVLVGQPILLYEPAAQTRRLVDDWFAEAGLTIRPTMELDSVEAMKELVRAGLGLGIVPGMAMGTPDRAPKLRVQSLTPRLTRSIGLVLRRDKPLHRGLRETIAALRRAAPRFARRRSS